MLRLRGRQCCRHRREQASVRVASAGAAAAAGIAPAGAAARPPDLLCQRLKRGTYVPARRAISCSGLAIECTELAITGVQGCTLSRVAPVVVPAQALNTVLVRTFRLRQLSPPRRRSGPLPPPTHAVGAPVSVCCLQARSRAKAFELFVLAGFFLACVQRRGALRVPGRA